MDAVGNQLSGSGVLVLEWLKEYGTFGTGLFLGASVGGLFWKLDDAIADVPRQALSRFLQRFAVEPPYPNLPEIVAGVFDRVFGTRHLSWRCFSISCLFSALAVTLLTAVYLRNNYIQPQLAFEYDVGTSVIILATTAVALNLIPDYISLMETRFVVRWMSRTQKLPSLFGYLGLDVVLTLFIFVSVGGLLNCIAIAVLFTGISLDYLFSPLFFAPIPEMISALMTKETAALKIGGALGIFLYSTFFTSVWVWLTALGWGAIRLIALAPPLLRAMQYLLPIKERPLRSIGEVAAVIVCLGYWGVSAIT